MDWLTDDDIDLDALIACHGARIAIEIPGETISFARLHRDLSHMGTVLAAAGLKPRGTVALYLDSSLCHLFLCLAAWVFDFKFVPLNTHMPLSSVLERFIPDILISEPPPADPPGLSWIRPGALYQRPRTGPAPNLPKIRLDQEASVIFTSGSTDAPKGVVHSVGNQVYSALGTNAFLAVSDQDRWLVSLPLYHVGGLMIFVRTLLAGACCVLPKPGEPLESAIDRFGPTILSLVPTQLLRLVGKPPSGFDLRTCKAILLGGGPCPAPLITRALDLGLPIVPSYGATESCAQVTGVPKGSPRKAYYTAGLPLSHREIEITHTGLIRIGGKTLFKRYLDHSTGAAASSGGWFTTTDCGRLDEDGNLVVLGRADLVFISGGENINPLQIENALTRLPQISQAVVVPVAHAQFGHVAWAFVARRAPIDDAQLKQELKKELPGYMIPKRFLALDDAVSISGIKPDRRGLQKRAAAVAGGCAKE